MIAVAGRIMTKTIRELERALLVCIEDEQNKLNADNHLIGTLCECVRLCREFGDSKASAVAAPTETPVKCGECNGTGKRSANHTYNEAGGCIDFDEVACPECHGTGEKPAKGSS